jgi:hypothetical protein
MGSGLVGKKKKDAYKMPPHTASRDQTKWQQYCINNNIRISPYGINNQPGKWKIAIALGSYKKSEKIYYAPHIYDKNTIWLEYYNMCKYYYEKQ